MLNQETKIPWLLLSFGAMEKISRRFKSFGNLLSKLKPKLEDDLRSLNLDIDAESYAFGSLLSALVYGLVFSLIVFLILGMRGGYETEFMYRISAASGIGFLTIFFLLHLYYPSILSKKNAAKENKDLLFALRDIMMMVESGVLLYDAMKNVAKSNYGHASKDFERVVKKIETGRSEREALKQLALTSESEYMKRACWQLVNALESGAIMENALASIVNALENQIYRDIKNYSANLNFLMLLYMLVAAAIPSLGITFLALLSVFSGIGVTPETILGLVGGSVFAQIVIIGYISNTRPEIFGG